MRAPQGQSVTPPSHHASGRGKQRDSHLSTWRQAKRSAPYSDLTGRHTKESHGFGLRVAAVSASIYRYDLRSPRCSGREQFTQIGTKKTLHKVSVDRPSPARVMAFLLKRHRSAAAFCRSRLRPTQNSQYCLALSNTSQSSVCLRNVRRGISNYHSWRQNICLTSQPDSPYPLGVRGNVRMNVVCWLRGHKWDHPHSFKPVRCAKRIFALRPLWGMADPLRK